MGFGRAAACRTMLGIALGVTLVASGGCGAAHPIQSVTARPAQAPVATPEDGPPAAPSGVAPAADAGLPAEAAPTVVRGAPRGAPPVTGRLDIPKIGLSHITYEGNSLAQIDYGPSHWPGTPLPGHLGNTVFPGHRTTHSRPFWDIDKLVPGDAIVLTTTEGRFVYEVTESHIVRPTEMWVVDPTPTAVVTIFGCHPRGSASYRYVVRGRLVSTPVADHAGATPAPAPRPPPGRPPAPPARPAPTSTTTTTTPRANCVICLP
jgi:sortase A